MRYLTGLILSGGAGTWLRPITHTSLGRNVKLTRGAAMPKTLRLLVGDNSEIDMTA